MQRRIYISSFIFFFFVRLITTFASLILEIASLILEIALLFSEIASLIYGNILAEYTSRCVELAFAKLLPEA
jgi:hypothetical protein